MAPAEEAHPVHRYAVVSAWSGSTAGGYDHYNRAHHAEVPATHTALTLSSDPAFGGDPTLLNPEQLVVLAASSCQLLSFLAVAARARVDVRRYEDRAEGTMTGSGRLAGLDLIVLRPVIYVAEGASEERVAHLVEVAHRECFVANSLRTEVRVEPTVVVGPGRSE